MTDSNNPLEDRANRVTLIVLAATVLVLLIATPFFMSSEEDSGVSNAVDTQEERLAFIAAQREYLAMNAEKEDVSVTESGLQYRVIAKGEGGAQPTRSDKVRVHYRGRLINGEEFDSSYSRDEPSEFPLGRVISGWTEGIPLMHVGDKYEFTIPFRLAYGEGGIPGVIPPFATLVFEVELLEIVQ